MTSIQGKIMNGHWWINKFIPVAAFIIAVPSAFITLSPFFADQKPHSLTVKLLSSVALQPVEIHSIENLQVIYDGNKIEEPYLSTIEILNDGANPILAKEFEEDLEISLNDKVKLVKVALEHTIPEKIKVGTAIESEGLLLKIKPILFNPNDTIIISVLTSGGKPQFIPYARIANVSKVGYEQNLHVKGKIGKAYFLIGVTLLLGYFYMFFMMSVMYFKYIPVTKTLAFITALTLVTAGSFTLQTALVELGRELDWNLFYKSLGVLCMYLIILYIHYNKIKQLARITNQTI